MTPETLAALHKSAMTAVPAPWSAQDFADLLASPNVFLVSEDAGFALGRAVLDEAELLTLAVGPMSQRSGIGMRLLAGFESAAQKNGATRAFLEVAATNTAAKSLYVKAGWSKDGLRKGYYRANDRTIDAILMSKVLSPAS